MDDKPPVDEHDWISDRLMRLRYMRQFVTDQRALDALDALIIEGEQRLDAIRARGN
jgi:hypothetical protein